jgi:hypothetical protein
MQPVRQFTCNGKPHHMAVKRDITREVEAFELSWEEEECLSKPPSWDEPPTERTVYAAVLIGVARVPLKSPGQIVLWGGPDVLRAGLGRRRRGTGAPALPDFGRSSKSVRQVKDNHSGGNGHEWTVLCPTMCLTRFRAWKSQGAL